VIAAQYGPSARLALYALALDNHPNTHGATAKAKVDAGLFHPLGSPAQLVAQAFRIYPIVFYDHNINGGIYGQTVMLGGLPFDIAPKARAVSGIMAGAQANFLARYSLSYGRVIEARASAAAAQQLGGDLALRRAQAQLCAAQYLGHAHWLDICMAQNAVLRALAQTRSRSISAALSRQFAAHGALGELGFLLRRSDFGSHSAASAQLWLHLARRDMLSFQFEFGQARAGHHSRLFAASAAVTRPILGKKTTLSAQYARDGGGDFFGQTRLDENLALGLARPLRGGEITLSLGHRQSSLPQFTGPQLGLNLTFDLRAF
jgi:hypothetical protein